MNTSTERRLPSPATLIALVALFAALGGSAVAATTMIRSSKDVRDRSIAGKDLSSAATRALRGQTGPSGPQGPQGVPGPAGQSVSNEPYRTVGAPGEPAFVGGWSN